VGGIAIKHGGAVRHDEIDPQLPYIQIHRSVGTKAAQLAPILGLTYQHVRGSLDVFWESLADRRLLSGKTVILLPATELVARLRLAFGQVIDFEPLVHSGLLEAHPGGLYRVRGMSRYLEAEAKRAGKKSRGTHPNHQSSTPPQVDQNTTHTPPQVVPHPTSGGPAPHLSETEVRGERREARGERREEKGERREAIAEAPAASQAELPGIQAPPEVPKVATPRALNPAEKYFQRFTENREGKLFDLGIPFVPLPEPNWRHIGATVQHWQQVFDDPDDPTASDRRTRWLIDEFFEDPYWAGATDRKTGKPEPYPWSALSSKKIYEPLVKHVLEVLEAA
jgi:hypothetical protein